MSEGTFKEKTLAPPTTAAKRRRAKGTRVGKPRGESVNGNGTAQAGEMKTVAAASTTRRRRRRNNKGLTGITEVDHSVLAALQSIRASKEHMVDGNPDVFRPGIQVVIEKISGNKPSRITAYRSVKRMAEAGVFRIIKDGERGHFTYDFGAVTHESQASASPATPAKKRAAVVVSASSMPLVERKRELTEEIARLEAQLQQQVDALTTQATVLKAAVTAETLVPA